jgi:gamma-glutamyltranspeptidase/glutathione hydrolase
VCVYACIRFRLQPYQAGDTFVQPELAAFLRNVSAVGGSYMYTGSWAQSAVELLNTWGSNITSNDFTAYSSMVLEPLEAIVGDWRVRSTSAPFGGIDFIEQMLLLNVSRVSLDSSTSYTQNATLLYWLIQFSRWTDAVSSLAHAAPALLPLVETEFGLNLSDAARITLPNAEAVWALLSSPGGADRVRNYFCMLAGCNGTTGMYTRDIVPKHSDGVVAIDAKGNVCSMIHTANSAPWGSGLFVQVIVPRDMRV